MKIDIISRTVENFAAKMVTKVRSDERTSCFVHGPGMVKHDDVRGIPWIQDPLDIFPNELRIPSPDKPPRC